MTPNPIHKVLSSFRTNRVRALLMGGQACIVYGAAEFSRDIDLAVLCSTGNLSRLRRALEDLQAEPIVYPPLEAPYLERGHACHFRCHSPEAEGLRVDIMSVLRGCDPFERLWQRRLVIVSPDLGRVNLLSLPDLVTAKKTQRDKDWPMIRRLMESDYFTRRRSPDVERLRFWLRELRTPELIVDLANRYRGQARQFIQERPLLLPALAGDMAAVAEGLQEEEKAERSADREYWQPLRQELEMLRRSRARALP